MKPEVGQIYVLNDPPNNYGYWHKIQIVAVMTNICYTKCIVDWKGNPVKPTSTASLTSSREINQLLKLYRLAKENIVQDDLKELLK